MASALVRFTPGARMNWHSHANGQVLYIIDGAGLVGTRGSRFAAPTGDFTVTINSAS
ncbi:cupin domain-containing protein [Streptomyces sp. NPDC047525]|uniref:cupin domain-containing protein n=1 Tax=Streptomyces sp. NPDC047525 TaxID=3155264 RepID=UPI0034016814